MATFVTAFTLPMKRLPENIMVSAIGLINTGGTLGASFHRLLLAISLEKATVMKAHLFSCHWQWCARAWR